MRIKIIQDCIDKIRHKKKICLQDISLKTLIKRRNQLLFSLIDEKELSYLEIGPLHCPQINSNTFNCKYADIYSKEELSEYYKDDQNVILDLIPNIDFIIDPYNPSEGVNEKFNCIIANHVIEHTHNPIKYIQSLLNLLNNGGYLFMAIPSKESTFDNRRELTTTEHLIEDFLNENDNERFSHIYEFNKYVKYCHLPLKEIYNKTQNEVYSQNKYSHIHYHVFNCNSFENFIKETQQIGLLKNIKIKYIGKPFNDIYEFYVLLEKIC